MTDLPTVTVCTPTYNRFVFIPTLLDIFRNQDYPKSKLQWVIVDDGNFKVRNIVEGAQDLRHNIKYIGLDKKISLGAKRNLMHQYADGEILVYMDDDDYYPPERISHAVNSLRSRPDVLCAGSTEMYLYFAHLKKMFRSGPFFANHATAATFAFRRELLKMTKYDESAAKAEESKFLKDYTIPLVQLNPLKTLLVFPHDRNTVDKQILMKNSSDVFKESNRTVDMWIKNPNEARIKDFFMNRMIESVQKIPDFVKP
jgi:glycosyltransferase involved in cell wall biosynthesis